MVLYFAGMLFTYGFLDYIDAHSEVKHFTGFKGEGLLVLLCLTWPFTMGALVAEHILDSPDEVKK